MPETITATKYARILNTSPNAVIKKIKTGELKGHHKNFVWYVDDVDIENLK